MMTYADLLASADARAWQNQANTQQNSAAANALAQAQFDWQKQLGTAGQTGMWNGAWNMPTQQYFANTFGAWGAPTTGQQTLQGQQTAADIAQNWSQMFGQYYAPGTAPAQGAQTQAAQQAGSATAATVAGLTGMYNAPGSTGPGTQTLAGQQQAWQQGFQQQQFAAQQAQLQQQNAQSYLQLLSNLRGPADWAKYQEVLGSTPGGMRDLAAAAMGQYVPGGGATTGVQPQAANLQTMMGQIAGQPQGNAQWNAQPQQAQAQYYNQAQAQMPSQNYWQPPAQQPAAQPAAQASPYPTNNGLTQLTPDAQSYLYSGTGAQIGGNGW